MRFLRKMPPNHGIEIAVFLGTPFRRALVGERKLTPLPGTLTLSSGARVMRLG